MRFAKWQGLGNNYIIVREHEFTRATPAAVPVESLVRALCDRNFGIGSDGVLVVGDDAGCDASMVVYNPDGSIAEMCGNGIRMVARYLLQENLVTNHSMEVATGAGVIRPEVLEDGRVRVAMGRAVVSDPETLALANGDQLTGRAISMGNPHFVSMAPPDTVDLDFVGPQVETHRRFPGRTNVEFWIASTTSHARARVWERGVGETLACGTGACAIGVAAVVDGYCTSPVSVELPGGVLEIEVTSSLEVTMTGPAFEVFRGELDIESLLDHSPASTPEHQETPA